MRKHTGALFVLALVLNFASAGAETLVNVPGDDLRGEVCRFKAGGSEDPFQRWLTSQEVTCVASGSVMTFPSGLWNVFGRRPGAVSADPILIDGASAPESLTLPVTPAATLTVQLPTGHTGVLYAPRHVTALPATERTSVPASEELWLFVLAKSVPVGVVIVPGTEAGGERVVDARNLSMVPAVVGWVQVPDADHRALDTARGVSAPQIRVAMAGKETETTWLPPPEEMDGAFILMPRGVAAGDAELQLTGRGWLPVRQRITVEKQGLTVVRQPIVARATARLVVNWNTLGDLPALDRSLGTCEPPAPPRFDLTISACAPRPPGSSDPPQCHPIRTEPLAPQTTFGTVTIDEVTPGLYRAELRFGKLPPQSVSAEIAPLERRPMELQVSYLQAYGSLTRVGKPLGEDARIEFGQAGLGFVARDSDEYHAVLTGPVVADAKVDIVTCRGERAFVLVDRPMPRTGRLDLDIPDNVLTVTVVDTFTRMPVSSATLRYVVMSANRRLPAFTRVLTQGDADIPPASADHAGRAEGRFVIKAVPPQHEIHLQVTNRGYKKQDVEPFSMSKSDKKEIEIQLVPLNGSEGRIVSAHPFEKAAVFWFSAAGMETEHADLAPDGTFVFDGVHLRDETMAVVSLSHPLWIVRPPIVERAKPLEVHFPDAAKVREAEVWIPGMPYRMATIIGVVIGGLRVPAPALVQHLALRGIQPFLRGPGPLSIPALAETGPIDILRGPSAQPGLGMVSPEALALRDFPPVSTRRLEPGIERVVFEGK
jgi:hypothetical protein